LEWTSLKISNRIGELLTVGKLQCYNERRRRINDLMLQRIEWPQQVDRFNGVAI
jgi:hypothetical protein